jgi:hypothetical protein
MNGGKTVGDGLDDLALGIVFIGAGIAAAAFFLSVAQCGAAEKAQDARRYEACMRATLSVKECGKP